MLQRNDKGQRLRQWTFFLMFVAITGKTVAQGCSDAGFCSLGAMKDVNIRKSEKQKIDIGSTVGFGEENTFTVNPYVQYNRLLGKRFTILGKVTATYASGFLGSGFSPGDFFSLLTYAVTQQGEKHDLKILAGVKVPFTSSNTKNSSGGALPLDYQSSLGTYDLVAGMNYVFRKRWELNGGLQIPLIHNNKNTFFPDEYADKRAERFAPTNYFERMPDLLLRGSYYFSLPRSFTVKPGLLAVYHLGKDSYENRFGKRERINGSEGLTLNAAVSASKQLKNKTVLELVLATPLVVRKVRADGLTRSLVVGVQYSIPLK